MDTHTIPEPLTDAEALRIANEGARRAFCPKCERGHDGECTGPRAATLKRVTLTRAEAMLVIDNGGEVFAVAEANTFRLFNDADAAREWADRLGVTHVLDWETGEYADA